MSSVILSGVRKLFGAMEVIKGIDLVVEDREMVVFVGPSGCGKSTLLRMIAGLEDVDYGSVEIGGQDVTERAPTARGRGNGIPELRAVSAYVRLRQSRLRTAADKGSSGRGGHPGARGGEPASDHRTSGPAAEVDVGRPASAGGHWPRHRAQARGVFWFSMSRCQTLMPRCGWKCAARLPGFTASCRRR